MVEYVYRDWAEQPIAALDNLSPREAVETQRGKTRVLRLLRTYERDETRKAEESGHPPARLAFLYEQVGLMPSR